MVEEKPEWVIPEGTPDNPTPDAPPPAPPGTEIAGDFDQRGSLMAEVESFERIMEGMKMAAEGAHCLKYHKNQQEWGYAAALFDHIRKTVADMSGRSYRAGDVQVSNLTTGKPSLPLGIAFQRVTDGLKMAGKGAQQMANAHRLDLRWLQIANSIQKMEDYARKLAFLQNHAKITTSILLPN